MVTFYFEMIGGDGEMKHIDISMYASSPHAERKLLDMNLQYETCWLK